MFVNKSIKIGQVLKGTFHHIAWLSVLSGGIAALYYFKIIHFSIPWLPVSVIGTAVAFYAGFKNNQAYDRMWEARKIWGGIVNDSRTWGMMVDGYVSNLHSSNKLDEKEIDNIKKRLIYRHIGWLYTHRNQLLVPTPWEHSSQGGVVGKFATRLQDKAGLGLVAEEVKEIDLKKLRDVELIDDFRHMEMVNVLKSFYTLQGKNERIKKFPLPRQYANMSRIFIGIFITLLPFSMIPELLKLGDWALALSVPITALIGWVYVMMEVVGDYSKNPFQGMANDIPMLSLCRVIEIDLREMLGETDLPPSIEAKKGILM